MKKEIYTFKEELSKLIDQDNNKVWLNKKASKRIDYIFKVGQEQFTSSEVIGENDEFLLLGQNIDKKLKDKLAILFNDYFNSDKN
jgi:hypothetical protein